MPLLTHYKYTSCTHARWRKKKKKSVSKKKKLFSAFCVVLRVAMFRSTPAVKKGTPTDTDEAHMVVQTHTLDRNIFYILVARHGHCAVIWTH